MARHPQEAVARALARAATQAPHGLNPYLSRYLSGHLGEVGGWDLLSEEVLDQLDVEALAADAVRNSFGSTLLPAEIAAVLSTRDRLASTSEPLRRRAIRRTGMAWISGPGSTSDDAAPWLVVWVQLRPRPVHVVLTGHTSGVSAVAAVPLPDGRTLLATGSHDGTVRLWDLQGREELLVIEVLASVVGLSANGDRLVVAVPEGLMAVQVADHVVQIEATDRSAVEL